MTSTALKSVAFLFMVIDHIGVFIPGTPIWFRWIGRLAQPIFLYCLLWSIKLTTHRERFLFRLYGAGLTMGIVSFLCNKIFSPVIPIETNIFTSFFVIMLVILAVEPIKNIKESKFALNRTQLICALLIFLGIIVSKLLEILGFNNTNGLDVLVDSILPSVNNCEVGIYYIMLGLLLYYSLESPIKICVIFGIYTLIPAILLMFFNFKYTVFLNEQYQWMAVFSIPFLLSYNKKRGRNIKSFFYLGYIIHLPLLCLIGNIMSS